VAVQVLVVVQGLVDQVAHQVLLVRQVHQELVVLRDKMEINIIQHHLRRLP
jgi:hypothetical protein